MLIEKLDALTILNDEIFEEVIDEKDEILRQRLILELTDKAKMLGVKTKFESMLKQYLKAERRYLTEEKRSKKVIQQNLENWTNFDTEEYQELMCGNWTADETGIRTFSMFGECLACYHPIMPIEKVLNIETGQEKIKLAFKRNNRWREIIVEKNVVSSNTKIVALSDVGIAVTSENSRFLVKYLSDVENFNENLIPIKLSTSKMGWIDDEFMPYHLNVLFDGNGRFNDTFEAITEKGDYNTWLKLIKKIRATKRIEPKMFLAASFGSVLVEILGALPFIVNLWGETEGGKTVTLMLATSIWANPSNNKYITDFKTTDVALEVRSDFLNHLPLCIDDTATVKEKYKGDMSSFIYDVCKGKGKGRSNKQLGINRENSWKNIILTTGEHPLSNEQLQGGAINRVLDVECEAQAIYENGNQVVNIISKNYGFAGKIFIDIVKQLGAEKIKEMQEEFLQQVKNGMNMEKQSISLSILLTADKIATDYIFKDNEYLDIKQAETVLVDKQALSEHERCYEFILGEVAINPNRFSENAFGDYAGECWGMKQSGYIIILKNIFDNMCKKGGFSEKAFLSWANKKGLIETQKGNPTKVKKIKGNSCRCVFLKEKDNEEFEEIPDLDNPPFE